MLKTVPSKRGGFRHLTLLQLKDLDGEVEALNLGKSAGPKGEMWGDDPMKVKLEAVSQWKWGTHQTNG